MGRRRPGCKRGRRSTGDDSEEGKNQTPATKNGAKPKPAASEEKSVAVDLKKSLSLYAAVTTDLAGTAALKDAIKTLPEWKELNSEASIAPLQDAEDRLRRAMEDDYFQSMLLKTPKDWMTFVKGKFGAGAISAKNENLRKLQAGMQSEVDVLKGQKMVRERASGLLAAPPRTARKTSFL